MGSTLTRKFGTSERSNIARKTETPGPGNYRLPSEFGYYCAKNARKLQSEETHRKKDLKDNKENSTPA